MACRGLEFLRRTDKQFHWENRGYDSFAAFLGDLSSSKRKNLRKERAAVVDGGRDLRMAHRARPDRSGVGRVLRLLHRDRQSEMEPALPDAEILQPDRRRHGRADPARDGEAQRALCRGRAEFLRRHDALRPQLGLHGVSCRSSISRPATTRRSTLRSRKGFARVEAGAQGGHKLLRGYLPCPTYSAHYIAHTGLETRGRGLSRKRARRRSPNTWTSCASRRRSGRGTDGSGEALQLRLFQLHPVNFLQRKKKTADSGMSKTSDTSIMLWRL